MTRAGDGEPFLVWCAGVSWDSIRGTDRHLVTHLADHRRVLWVDPPLSVLRARGSVGSTGLGEAFRRDVARNVDRLTVLVPPFPRRRWTAPVAAALYERRLRRARARYAGPLSAVVVTSPLTDVGDLGEATRVYYATDDFTAGAALMGLSADRVRRAEARAIATSDVLMAVSPEIIDHWRIGQRTAHVLRNGCDPDHYARVDALPTPPDVVLPAPVAGLVGQISPRIDLALLEEVAARGISLLMVGPVDRGFQPERVARLFAHPNVQWVGEKRFDELPSYLQVIDVGLTPYAASAFNRASFPLKTLEYLAAGRAVVSTPLPAVQRLGTDLVRSAGSPRSFAALVQRSLAEAGDVGLAARCRKFAEGHSWATRARDFLQVIGPQSERCAELRPQAPERAVDRRRPR